MTKDKDPSLEESITDLRKRLDEAEKALGLKPNDEDMQRLKSRIDSVMERIDEINCPAPHPPKFETLKGTREAFYPVLDGGLLLLKYAPPAGTGLNINKDRARLLVTGTKIIVPEGYTCAVGQMRAHGSAQVFQHVVHYAAGTTAEIEILCSANDHDGVGLRVAPGQVIAGAWLERAGWSKKIPEAKA